MATFTEIEISYAVTRSKEYQSVKLEGRAKISLTPEDDKRLVVDKARKWLSKQLNDAAQQELDAILYGPTGDIG